MTNNIQNNVSYLCSLIEGAKKASGEVNITAAARILGIQQTTLMRIVKGQITQLRPDTEKALQDYFRISKADLYDDDLEVLMKSSRVDRLAAMIDELTPEEVLELQRRMPSARIVLE